jgi:hypothetical protein
VGRSLVVWLVKNNSKISYLQEVHGFHMNDFVLSAAALAHDIGKPPFDILVRKHRRIFHWRRKTVQRAVNK